MADKLFVGMLAVLSCQVSPVYAHSYWTYFPDPPLLHPVTLMDPSIKVFTNHTTLIGGESNTHITPQWAVFNYTGQSASPPTCLSSSSQVGCLQLSYEFKVNKGKNVMRSASSRPVPEL